MDDIRRLPKYRTFTEAEQAQRRAEFEYVSERLAQFYTEPDKAKVRRRAKKIIAQRLGEVLLPHGFEPGSYGTSWGLDRRGVRRSVRVQAGKAGARCFVNVGRVPNAVAKVLGQPRVVERLSRFGDSVLDQLDPLYYFDIEERPPILNNAIEVMEAEVVPWLLK